MIYFAPEPKKNTKSCVWVISEIQMKLGPNLCNQMLYIHAMLGCDTTCLLKKIRSSEKLQQSAKVFDDESAAPEEIAVAGEKALVEMYNGKKNESLNALRKRKYCEKVAKSLHRVEGKSLPPTTAASKFHSYRVYLQICQWKNPHCNLQEESWGWKLTDSGYSPVLTDLPPAPPELLIRYDCTTDCTSARCTCRKNGLKCTLACGHC